MLLSLHLRVLLLATTTCLATMGCGSKEEAPQPQPPIPIASLSTHSVAVRYQARAVDGATQQLPPNLNLLVEYERVGQTGPALYRLLAPSAQFHDAEVSTTAREVPLSLLATHPGAIRPKITVTVWQEQALPTPANASYDVTCDLVVDGKVTSRTTYVVVAGQIPPLQARSQTEVTP